MSDASETPTTESQVPNPTAATSGRLSLLAAEAFGDEFHGEVPEATEVAVQTPEAPATDAPDEGQTEATEEAEPDVSELIRQHFEQDGELLKKIKLGVKVDGQKVEDKSLRLMPGATHVVQVGKRKFAKVALKPGP